MKHLQLSLAALVFTMGSAKGQTVSMGFSLEGTEDVGCSHVQFDAAQNIIVGGGFLGTLDIDPASGSQVGLTETTGWDQGYLAKYSPNGSLLWGFALNTSEGGSSIRSMKVDAQDGVLLWLRHEGTVNLNPLGPAVLTTASTATGDIQHPLPVDLLLVRYGSDGHYDWHKRIGGSVGYLQTSDMALDPTDGDILIMGSFSNAIDLDQTLTSEEDSLFVPGGGPVPSTFVASYSSDGTFIDARSFDISLIGHCLAVRPSGEVVCSFNRSTSWGDTTDLDPGLSELLITDDTTTAILIDYLSDFTPLWFVPLGGSPSMVELLLAPNGDALVAGPFQYSFSIDGLNFTTTLSSIEQFIAMVHQVGSVGWVKKTNQDGSSGNLSLELDPMSNLVIGFPVAQDGDVDLDGPGNDPEAELEAGRYFAIAQLDALTGDFIHAWQVGDLPNFAIPDAIATNSLGQLAVAGTLYGSCDFDPTSGTEFTLVAADPDYEPVYLVVYDSLEVGFGEQPDARPVLTTMPNPFSTELRISITSPHLELLAINDSFGRQILSSKLPHTSVYSWNGRTTSGTEVPPGMYLVTVIADGQRYTQRVIKQ